MIKAVDPADAIAVIGLSARLPGVASIPQFRDAVLAGRALFETATATCGALSADPGYVPKGAYLQQDIAEFDAAFFGLSERRAQVLDPQHRLFLECAWEALESAGYATGSPDPRVGVFGGCSANAYLLKHLAGNPNIAETIDEGELELGGNKDHLALFTAYAMQLTGIAVTVQSCCSTSLLAVHLAIRSLREGECEIALAGGVSLRLPAGCGYHPKQGGILSPSGACRPFDAAADGTIFGSGAAVVALKRLEDALAAGDTIHATLLGSAANNDGGEKSSYTAPSSRGQAEVLAEALTDAQASPCDVGYVEAHGTGTMIGDPIEFDALRAIYGAADSAGPCYLGAIKANIGHLDVASGAAGLINAILTVRENRIAPIAGLATPNPMLRLEGAALAFAAEPLPFAPSRPLAAVSSFGIGGTNVHVVLGPPPVQNRSTQHSSQPAQPLEFPLSARTPEALDAAARRLADHLRKNPHCDMAAVAHTLQHGRKHMSERLCVAAITREELIQRLDARSAADALQAGPVAARYLSGSNDAFDAGAKAGGGRRIQLPTYPFERRRYWIDPPPRTDPVARAEDGGPERARRIFAECCPQPLEEGHETRELLELGFDSLSLTVLAERLEQELGVEIPFAKLIAEGYTPARLLQAFSQSRPAHDPAGAAKQAAGTASTETPPTGPGGAEPVSHGPFLPARSAGNARLFPRQRAFIADVVARTLAMAPHSRRLAERSRPVLADPRTIAGFDPRWKQMAFPIVAERCAGADFVDVDGNSYVDMVMGFGVHYLGHSPSYVNEAVLRQIESGYAIGPQNALAHEVASLICGMTGCDRLAFANTGSEAVAGALRIARAATRRDAFAYFANSYHGGIDSVLGRRGGNGGGDRAMPVTVGIPASALAESRVLEFGQESALDHIRREGEKLAAVLVEPVQSRNPALVPVEFLHRLRSLCDEMGIVLIFDEIITGFRCHPGGAQALFGVTADLCTYGKVIGGGLPIAAIAGRADLMAFLDGGEWRYDDDSAPDHARTFFAGTFVRHPLALAAAKAALEHIESAGPTLQVGTTARVTALRERINAKLRAKGAGIALNSFASFLSHDVAPGSVLPELLFPLLRTKEIYVLEGRMAHLSTVHDGAAMTKIEAGYCEAVDEMLQHGLLTAR